MNDNQLKAFKSSYEELEHLFNDRSFEDVQKDTIIIPSVTNINFRYKNLIIRHPRKNLNIFFNRKNEYLNINLVNKYFDLIELPLYYNQESGLMVNYAKSPEVFFQESDLNDQYITQCVSNLNLMNGQGIAAQEAFNYEVAFAYFRSTGMFDDKSLNWVESFYKRFFVTEDNYRLEFSHNDPDISNFTITNELIDYEYSGMSPVMSDICNFYAMYSEHQQVNRYFINTNAPKRDMEPLVIYWSLFWGMWGLSKDKEDIVSKDYFKNATNRLNKGIKRLDKYQSNNT